MLGNWNFATVTPAGERPPSFPGGFHVGLIKSVEDSKPKEGESQPRSFFVTIIPHPQHRDANVPVNAETRVYYNYDEKSAPYVMHLLMCVGYTVETLRAHPLAIDLTAPNSPLLNKPVFFEQRIGARKNDKDPNKPYDESVLMLQETWNKAKAEAAGKTRAADAMVGGGQQQQQQQQQQQVQTAGLPGTGLPTNGVGGLPGTNGVGGGLPGLPGLPS